MRPAAQGAAAFVALCGASTALQAEEVRSAVENTLVGQEVKARNAEGALLMSGGSPDDRAMAGFQKPNITFSTENDETSVSLAFSFDLEDRGPKLVTANGADFVRVRRTKVSIVATAPIEGENSKLGGLFAGDTLVNGTKVKVSFSRLTNRLGNGKGGERFIPGPLTACLAEQAVAWRDAHPAKRDDADGFADGMEELTPIQIEDELEDRAGANGEASIEHFLFVNCVPGGDPDAEGRHRFGEEGELVDAYSANGPAYRALFYDNKSTAKFYGVDASVGQDKYDYLDSVAFQNAEASKTSWEIGAYAGLINWDSTFSARLRGVYGQTWELPDETETCETFGTPPEEHCLTGPDGPPTRVRTGLVSFEARKFVDLDENTRIAFAPQVTYRFEDDFFGVEVPVYLVPDEHGKLTGGLKFAWNSKDDEFGIGVFVGVPLNDLFE